MTNSFILHGTYTALITPFLDNGEIDWQSIKKLINQQINAGIDGIVILGTTGESPTISPQEHNEIIKFAIQVAQKRTKIIAGTGSNSTNECLEYSNEAIKNGADALLLVSPYYNKPTQRGLYEHFACIAKNISCPQIIYNIMGRTGVNIETKTLLNLANDFPNIIGVKEASGSVNQMMEVLEVLPSNFAVISGDDNLTFPLICLGGTGVISVLSNFMPTEVKNMVDLALNGEFSKARIEHFNLLPKMRACFLETNPIPIKTLHYLRGDISNSFRLPMTPASTETITKLKQVFEL